MRNAIQELIDCTNQWMRKFKLIHPLIITMIVCANSWLLFHFYSSSHLDRHLLDQSEYRKDVWNYWPFFDQTLEDTEWMNSAHEFSPTCCPKYMICDEMKRFKPQIRIHIHNFGNILTLHNNSVQIFILWHNKHIGVCLFTVGMMSLKLNTFHNIDKLSYPSG